MDMSLGTTGLEDCESLFTHPRKEEAIAGRLSIAILCESNRPRVIESWTMRIGLQELRIPNVARLFEYYSPAVFVLAPFAPCVVWPLKE